MPPRRNDPKPKPIEQWGVAEWKAAYNKLNANYGDLKKQLSAILVYLHRAIGRIQETIN